MRPQEPLTGRRRDGMGCLQRFSGAKKLLERSFDDESDFPGFKLCTKNKFVTFMRFIKRQGISFQWEKLN